MSEPQLLHELRQYLSAVHKRRWLSATCLAVTLLGATLYNYTTRPVYRASAQILIDRDAPRVLPNPNLATDQGGADYFQTQYELLRGRSLAQRVVESLQLNEKPEFQLGSRVSPWERLHGPLRTETQALAVTAVANAVRGRLTVEPLPGGHLVNLYFWAYDPALAAQTVNAIAALYIAQARSSRSKISTEADVWLTDRVEAQQAKSDKAEQALQAFREHEGLVNVEERQGLTDQKLAALAAALVSARTERIGKETLLAQMRALPPLQLSTFPAMMDNANVQKARAEVVDLQAEQTRLAETLGDRHPDMVKLRARLALAEEKLKVEIGAFVGSVEAGCEMARQQERGLAEAVETAKREALVLDRASIGYGVLKRDVETHQQLLRELRGRSQQTGLETELTSSSISLVEPAEIPRAPISPRTVWNYEMALAAGLMLGLGLAVLFERLDNTVKTPEDVKALDLPFLGMIPELKLGGEERGEDGPHVVRQPQSPVAEAYRVLRTNVLFSSAENSGRVLLVSSANPGEGKTTTVANLAASLAENGARVLAIDADLRRPTLHQHFGREKTPGLSDTIVGACLTAQALQPTRQKGLQLLPCGYLPPNPTELLGAANTRELIASLRKRYDWVLIDAPPVLAMADTPVLAPWADGVILVVWADVCPRPALQRAVDQLKAVGGKITGVVLNKVDLARNSYYYSQHYGEYYRSYYETTSEPAADGKRGLHSV
jgi:polysaccharide biosynthesis transport protein